MEKLPAQPLQGLIDGLAVLQRLAAGSGPLSGTELADALGLEKTKTNRILKTLAHLGFATRTSSRQYLPGPAMHVLSAQSLHASGLLRRALPELEELSKLGLVVALGVLWKRSVCYLYHHAPGGSKYEAIGKLGLYPAEGSSVGRAALAEMRDEDIRLAYEKSAPEGFESVDKFIGELEDVRRKGYAMVRWPDHISLSVSLGAGSEAAMALSGQIPEDGVAAHVEILKKAAERIALG